MINLKRIIALSLCTVMFINGTASSVEATIDNISSLSIADTDSSKVSGQTNSNKNTIIWLTSNSIEVGSQFDKMNGVKGYDKDGNDITKSISVSGEVDTSKPGEYLLEYSVTDDQGETIKATRKVIVEDPKTEAVVDQKVTTEEVKIVGSTFTRTYLTEPFDAKANIKATDSNGKDITDLITVEGEVDINKLGSYELKYSVTDETGKTATLTRKVNVINKNIFNKYIEKVNEETKEKTKELGFSIFLDNNTSKFLVENQSKDVLDPTRKDEVVFKIRVIDKDNKEKLLVELLGSDTGDSEKLNPLKELEYSFGDYIEINTENAKERFDISGEMSGDIKSKEDEETKADEGIKIEDYSDGVDNLDYLSNVRFKITEDGIETVYNNAPVISGLEPIEKALNSRDKQLEGVTVTDDHDGVISNDKIVITEEKDENDNVIALKYKVTDSWGRTTEATRIRNLIGRTSETPSTSPTTPETSLTENIISVKGIRFGTNSEYGDVDTRFKITFNDRSRKIYVINQDGRSMNSRIKDTYFKMVLYDSEGNEKRKVEINGDERSNTAKLDELKFQGWPYQYGDMISLWHYEAPVKISIAGNVKQDTGKETINFTNGLTKKVLEETRFELTSTGLKHTLNEAPVITFPEGHEELTVTRGSEVNLSDGVTFNDDRGVLKTEISSFDSTELGEHTVTYRVIDNWGVETVKERKVIVEPKNEIEAAAINVKSINNVYMFSIGFDEIKKQFVLKTNTENTDIQLNSENKSTELIITVFNKFNVKKREFKISGKDTVNSNSIQKLKNYRYEEGDYLQIIPKSPGFVTITGDIENVTSGIDYGTGVTDLDKWVNVRFQLDEGKLKYNYNQAPVISGNDKIEITRGNTLNVLQGMKATDDKEDGEVTLTTSNTEVTIKSGNGIFLGEQVYEIKYTDSWGRSASVERVVFIKPANSVEKQKIELFDGDKIILSFSYDSIDKKLKVLSYDGEYSFLDSVEENAFVLEFYDYESRKKQKEVVLKSEDLIDNEFLGKLTNFVVEDNWYMKLWYKDSNKIRVTSINPILENDTSEGNVSQYNPQADAQVEVDNIPESYTSSEDTAGNLPTEYDESNTDITFKSDDEMENTRFNISNSGITYTYNEAPKINGIDDVSIVYGSEFNPMQDVSVEDEDANLAESLIITGEIDTEMLGPQVLHYEVTDSYGRRTFKNRTVTVVPVYTSNEVVYKGENNNKIFSIGINHAATGFTVSLPETKSTESIQEDFIFRVFDDNHKELYKLEINSGTTINEELFNELKSWIVRPGYFFSVNSNNLNKIQIIGKLNQSSEEVKSVDYSNLTETNRDAVDNVRFEFTENIVNVVYNKAPKISIKNITDIGEGDTESSGDVVDDQRTGESSGSDTEDGVTDTTGTTDIVRAQAINLDDYNLLEGVSISDDKDDLSVEKIKIKLPEDKDILTTDLEKAKALIGKTVTITYQVADNWGRLSEEVTRNLTIKSAMDDIELKFLYAPTGSNGEANLVPDINDISLSMEFDMKNGNINLEKGNKDIFKGNPVQYGSFAVFDKDNNVKLATVLGNRVDYEKDDQIFGSSANHNNNVDNIINYINGKKTELVAQDKKLIEYGDKIVIKMYQLPFLHIYGKVINNQEDYSKGAYINGILVNSKFEVTPAGLKQIYTGPTMNENKFSQLTLYNIVAGTQSLNMYLDNSDASNLVLRTKLLDNEWLHTTGSSSKKLIRLQITRSDGTIVKGSDYVDRTQPSTIVNYFQNTEVKEGDYLTVHWESPSHIKNSRLYSLPELLGEDGLPKGPEQYGFPEEIDYSREIKDETYFNDVRFYFTSRGIIPVYNAAPTFEGIDDISISIGDEFNPRSGVSVKDYFDGAILDYTVTLTESGTGSRTGTVDTSRLGEYILTYSATDSWGRTGTYQRKVSVKQKVHENHFKFYTKDGTESFSIDFEPNFNNNNGMIKITKFSDKLLDVDRATDQVAKISIYNSRKEIKEEVILLGRDSSKSEQLNQLNDFVYEDGDYIKVWRAKNSDTNDFSVEGLQIIGDIDNDEVNFEDPQYGIDHMSNTVFYIRPTGLYAIYNHAPTLEGVKDITLYYGDTDYNLLKEVIAIDSEDRDGLTITVTPNTIDTNRLGKTEVTYSVTDSYGRTTSETANVTVRSKSYLNRFEIYEKSNLRVEQPKFSIGFNDDVNAFEFYNGDTVVDLNTIDLTTIPSDLNIILYSRFGGEKLNITLAEAQGEDEKKTELNKLKDVKVELFDMIQIITSDPSKIKLKGDVVSETTNNYESGFTSEEQMRSVRFQVRNQGLTEVLGTISDNAVTFNGLYSLTIKRGDDVNLLEGVTVTHPNEFITEISVSDLDEFTVGTQTVTYYATDSWGNTFEATREIEVLPFNKLEEIRITVSDTNKTDLINIKFDSITSTLGYELNNKSSLISSLRKVLSFSKMIADDTVVLKISTFNQDMMEMGSVSITKGDILNNQSNLEEINNVEFIEGGFIGIDVYDLNNDDALSITGPVIYPKTEQNQNRNQDMRYIRYEINETGIRAHYNRAPQVTAKEVEHRISESFDLNTTLTINDDNDSSDSMEVEFSEYDSYQVGKTEVTATVRDKWGLETEVQFNVYVLSHLDDNRITLKSDTNQELVTMGFDSKNGKLLVEFHRRNYGVPIISQSGSSETSESESVDNSIIKLNIYNSEQKLQKTIKFNADDTVDTIKTKLEDFNNYTYNYNYFIGLEVVDNAKSLIKIENVEKNHEKLESVNYENGVEDVDFFNNVRFQINPYGLIAIYNEAPTLTRDLGDITEVKSDNVNDYNLLADVKISDDKDKLSLGDVKVKYNNSENSSELHLGENTITLTVKDKWERESEAVTFKLNLTSAMNNIDITFLYADNTLKPNLDEKAAKLTFDMEQKRIFVKNESRNNRFKQNHVQYGAFGVYDKSGNMIFKARLGDRNDFDTKGEFSDATAYKEVDGFKEALERISGIDYGYKIKIKIYQSPFVYLNGNVINAQEDYSEGAYLSELLNESTFTITEAGLVQNYEKTESEPRENDIVWLSGVAGAKLFTINVNPNTRILTVENHSVEPLDTQYKSGNLFSIDIYDAAEQRSDGITVTGGQYASDIVTALNGKQFEMGGYMTIKIHPTDRNRVRNMKIYGDVIKTKSNLEDVDYSGVINDVSYFNEAKFYFTPNGLSLNYNEAPAFTGLTDVILLKEEEETVNLKEGVNVSDDNTENITYTIEDARGNQISDENAQNYSPTTLGAQEVYYVATDSLGRKTREPRFVWLQAASEISVKNQELLTVQQSDPKLDTEEKKFKYLIELVTVHDEEDDANQTPIQVTRENIETTFDPNTPGTYPVIYTVQDSDGNVTQATFNIQVVRTINVSVPTYIPFQLVTNLIKNPDTAQPDPFVSGVMKVSNNYLTDVEVSVKEFTKKEDTGGLEIVNPNKFADWSTLTEEETMKYMALGIYGKSNFENSSYNASNPLWLETKGSVNKNSDINSGESSNSDSNANKNYIGRLPKTTTLGTPNTGELSFTSMHGNKFIGGTTKGKFKLVLEFR